MDNKQITKAKINYIHSDSYHTDNNYPQALLDKMSMGTSAYFGVKFIAQLVKNRRLAVAGKFDTQTWASRSMHIFKLIEKCGVSISSIPQVNKRESIIFPTLLILTILGYILNLHSK